MRSGGRTGRRELESSCRVASARRLVCDGARGGKRINLWGRGGRGARREAAEESGSERRWCDGAMVETASPLAGLEGRHNSQTGNICCHGEGEKSSGQNCLLFHAFSHRRPHSPRGNPSALGRPAAATAARRALGLSLVPRGTSEPRPYLGILYFFSPLGIPMLDESNRRRVGWAPQLRGPAVYIYTK